MREDRIPTVPQAEERIPTMPQAEERIPTVPQAEARIPTMPQSNERITTVPQSDGRTATVPQGEYADGNHSNGAIIRTDCNFVGALGQCFTIHAAQVISADSGESQIYGCSKVNDAQKYVARVLKAITPSSPATKLHQRDKVIDFLLRNSHKEDTHILPLIDHGTVQQAGVEYFVEVYPFCRGGDLGQRKGAIPYETLCKEVIPAINEALHTFHQAGFVHRDVKPDNLYYYNGRVVLGDFGITCDLINNNFATDRTKTGTLGYYAPELMSQAAVKASDYYSFGQTLWTLYSGEMMYQNILRRFRSEGIEEQRNQVNFAMMHDTYYGLEEIKQEEHFFEILIRGLLQYDVGSRFDYEKVKRWLAGDFSLANEISKYQDVDTYPVPFRQAGNQYWNHAQLLNGLINNWEEAKELLYSGELHSFFQHFNPRLSNEIDQISKKYAKPAKNRQIAKETMYDIGVSQLILLLSKGECLVWGDVAYHQLIDLGKDPVPMDNMTNRYHANEEGFLCSGLVVTWYKMQLSKHKEKTNDYVVKVLTAAQDYATNTTWDSHHMAAPLSRAIVQHIFKALEGESRFEDCDSVEKLIMKICGKEGPVYGYYENTLLRNPEFYGFLCAQGYHEFADNLLRGKLNDFQRVELLFYFFERQAESRELKSRLVEFYKLHGPNAYLLWFKNNLNLYEFNGDEAVSLRKQIEETVIGGTTVDEVKTAYGSLLKLALRFRTLFVDNVYMAKMGLTGGKEKNGITSKHLFAYWHKKLFGMDVPIGFDIS